MDAQTDTKTEPKPNRLWIGLCVAAVAAAMGAYSYVFPEGPVNALLGIKPSASTDACIGTLKTPLCYVFGWASVGEEAPPFSVEYRKARLAILAAEHGLRAELRLSGGPHLSEEADLAGWHYWLGHASEADFEKTLANMDADLAMQTVRDLEAASETSW